MTAAPPDPPLAPDELVSTGGEREVLEAFLDLYRAVVTRKLAGLSDAQIRQRHVSSQTTLGGLISHLTAVDTAETLLAGYERACAASRRAASGYALEDSVPHPRLGQVSLRWIYVHLIEETARHAGHADILREQTDGATGFDG